MNRSEAHKAENLSAETRFKLSFQAHRRIWFNDGRHTYHKPYEVYVRMKSKNPNVHRGRLKFSDEARKNMSKAHNGKPLSDANKKSLSISLRGNTNSVGSHSNKGYTIIVYQDKEYWIKKAESKQFIANHPGAKIGQSSKHRRKNSKGVTNYISNNPRKFTSKPEKELIKFLIDLYGEDKVHPQFQIPDSKFIHPYDVMLEHPKGNILIEFDGTFYHSKAFKGYSESKDKQRKYSAMNHGYKFIIVTETEYEQYKFTKLYDTLH
jgi:hypothetical protein